jgi:predicted CXXCH cytochrome family protein
MKKGDCFAQECHSEMKAEKKEFQHKPYKENNCIACHLPEMSENNGVDQLNQRMICAGCHEAMEHEIVGSRHIHGPINVGDCTSCHSPHQSDVTYLLKETYNKLCNTCHKIERLFSDEFVHKPVKDGNCGLCHDPHASNYKSRLTDVGANLCIACHEEMVTGMTYEYVHTPLIKSGCSDCHDPHSGNDELRLLSSLDTLCFKCHTEKKNEIEQYEYKHEPAQEGKCIICHSPHYSENKSLLLTKVDELCYQCHKENRQWKERHFQHGPVVQGNCSACHNPHGSDNAYILRLSFPHKFYSPYEKGKYNLCFVCHKEAMVNAEQTETVTRFRNGKKNLHTLHVNQKKGRTCRACHDVHASDQEDHIREEFRFGIMDMPIYYKKSENGGTCIPGCHNQRSYDRINSVDNIVK